MSIAKMENGKWYVFVRYKDWTGTTRQHKKEGFTRQKDAKEYERQFLEKKTGSPDMTLSSLYAIYKEDCEARLKPTTLATKECMFQQNILPYLGQLKAAEIDAATIRKWQNQLLTSGKHKPTYLKTLHNQLSALFNFGVKYYGLKGNPCRTAGSMGKSKAGTMNFWTTKEFQRFIRTVERSDLSLAFSILFWCGIRKGELLALTPQDIDLSSETLTINKTFAQVKGKEVIQEPKTPKSKRTVQLPAFLAAQIRAFLPSIYGLGDEDRVFASLTIAGLRKALDDGAKAAGLSRIRVHDLRHSHASLLIELGYSPVMIAERLGHENVETTLSTYSHLYPDKQVELAKALDRCYVSATLKKSAAKSA